MEFRKHLFEALSFVNISFFFIFVVVFYFLYGPEHFPDFQNYYRIASNATSDTLVDGAIFENVSKGFLRNESFFSSPTDRIYFFSLVVQIVIILILMFCVAINGSNYSSALITAAYFFPLFFTTTLRASVTYILFFLMCYLVKLRRLDIFTFALITFIAIMFHDSGIIFVGVYFTYLVLQRFPKELSQLLVLILGLLVFASPILNALLIGFFSNFDFLRFTSYFLDLSFTLSKYLYLSCISIFVIMLNFFFKTKDTNLDFINAAFMLLAMLSLVNHVAAVRVSFFSIIAIFYFLGPSIKAIVVKSNLYLPYFSFVNIVFLINFYTLLY